MENIADVSDIIATEGSTEHCAAGTHCPQLVALLVLLALLLLPWSARAWTRRPALVVVVVAALRAGRFWELIVTDLVLALPSMTERHSGLAWCRRLTPRLWDRCGVPEGVRCFARVSGAASDPRESLATKCTSLEAMESHPATVTALWRPRPLRGSHQATITSSASVLEPRRWPAPASTWLCSVKGREQAGDTPSSGDKGVPCVA